MSHTKEPWYFENEGGNYRVMAADENGGYSLADMCCDDQEANARRIVACVNACAGSSVEWLEFSVSEDCADLSGPFDPLETRITSILKTGLEYMTERDALQSQLNQAEALSLARVLQISELQEQVECSTITQANMDGRLNISTVKLAEMTEQRDELLAALEQAFNSIESARKYIDHGEAHCSATTAMMRIDDAIASAKGGAK